MKIIFVVVLMAVFLAGTFAGSAVAGDVTKATTKAACNEAGGVWDTKTGKCAKKKKKGKRY